MSRFLKIAALFLAALWLPSTLHCRLETLGLDALFGCTAAHDESADHTESDPCATDGCQVIEDGQFTFAKSKIEPLSLPALACVCHLCLFLTEPPALAPAISPPAQDETLPLQRTWHFAHRAAAPARAPGLNA